jgi:hypothetical protein
MEQPVVRVQVTLTMAVVLQPDQTPYELARSIQHQVDQLLKEKSLGNIDTIKVFGDYSDALLLPFRQPVIELEGRLGADGWELARNPSGLPSTPNDGPRSAASNPGSVVLPSGASGDLHNQPRNLQLLARHRTRTKRKAAARAEKSINAAMASWHGMSQEKTFKHDFDNAAAIKRFHSKSKVRVYQTSLADYL